MWAGEIYIAHILKCHQFMNHGKTPRLCINFQISQKYIRKIHLLRSVFCFLCLRQKEMKCVSLISPQRLKFLRTEKWDSEIRGCSKVSLTFSTSIKDTLMWLTIHQILTNHWRWKSWFCSLLLACTWPQPRPWAKKEPSLTRITM